VASVIVTPTAQRDLEYLIRTHSLPATTTDRVKHILEPLGQFPHMGAPLHGRWARFRFMLGPWRWMIVVYRYDEATDQVAIVTFQDGRSSRAPSLAASSPDRS
jgi:plasmid stabilization system protein ParE